MMQVILDTVEIVFTDKEGSLARKGDEAVYCIIIKLASSNKSS